jgi:hypothetical protein
MENRKAIIEINTGDTPEMIQICLNCKMPRCIDDCPKMRKAKGKKPPPRKPGVLYPYKGGYMNLAEASRQSGIYRKTLKDRIEKLGLSLEQAIEKGPRTPNKRKEKKHEPSRKARAEKNQGSRLPQNDH